MILRLPDHDDEAPSSLAIGWLIFTFANCKFSRPKRRFAIPFRLVVYLFGYEALHLIPSFITTRPLTARCFALILLEFSANARKTIFHLSVHQSSPQLTVAPNIHLGNSMANAFRESLPPIVVIWWCFLFVSVRSLVPDKIGLPR